MAAMKQEPVDEDLIGIEHDAAEQKATTTRSDQADHRIRFLDLCSCFEKIYVTEDKVGRLAVLEKLWLQIAGSDFFPFMRLIVPQLDTARATYGLRESKIARYYIDLLGLSPQSPDAERFKNWRDPTKNSVESTHFSDVVFVVLTRRGYVSTASLTVAEVNLHLDHLATTSQQDEKKATLMTLLRSTSALEQKWIIRIISKEMKMNLQHGSILAAFHPTAVELYNNTNDLRYVCQKCTDPKEQLVAGDLKTGIFLMQPLKPMLASIVDSAKLNVLLRDDKLLIEPKYDGERMMLHVSGNKVMYWTRNAKNYTAQYGPKFDQVILKQLRGVQNCILDGEFLLYDGTARRFKDFGQNRTFAAAGLDFADVDGVKEWFCYCVFDIVFLNGESMVTLPLSKRKELLKSVLEPKASMCELVPAVPAVNVKSILTFLDDCISKGFEGVVIKIAGSLYVPGERKLKWLKLKPDHILGMADTVDLIILGGYYGTKFGVRHLSHFLLGVYKNEPSTTPRAPDAKFWTVCKVGTGYSENDLQSLNEKLESKWVTLSSIPKWLDGWHPAADDLPAVWIHPRDSCVMEIFGYSFTETTKFKLGHTIRFPRCHRLRYDKDITEATDFDQLQQIVQQSGNLFKKAGELDELVMVRKRKQQVKKEDARTALPVRAFATVPGRMMLKLTDAKTSLFQGYEACVLFASPDLVQRDVLESILQENGSTVVSNPSRLTSLIIAAGDRSAKVRNWIREATSSPDAMAQRYASIDVISHEWVLDCVAAGALLPLAPRHMIFTSPQLKLRFSYALDEFEDGYFEDATLGSLRNSLSSAAISIPRAETLAEAMKRCQAAQLMLAAD